VVWRFLGMRVAFILKRYNTYLKTQQKNRAFDHFFSITGWFGLEGSRDLRARRRKNEISATESSLRSAALAGSHSRAVAARGDGSSAKARAAGDRFEGAGESVFI